jgi:DNA damage-binding protein 2
MLLPLPQAPASPFLPNGKHLRPLIRPSPPPTTVPNPQSHDFNRYLTPFRAEFDPKDPTERTVVCGRCAPQAGGAGVPGNGLGAAPTSPRRPATRPAGAPPAPDHPPIPPPRAPSYISEEYGGQALHPIDVLDISRGRCLRALVDDNLTTISPVVAFHPRCGPGARSPSGSRLVGAPVPTAHSALPSFRTRVFRPPSL